MHSPATGRTQPKDVMNFHPLYGNPLTTLLATALPSSPPTVWSNRQCTPRYTLPSKFCWMAWSMVRLRGRFGRLLAMAGSMRFPGSATQSPNLLQYTSSTALPLNSSLCIVNCLASANKREFSINSHLGKGSSFTHHVYDCKLPFMKRVHRVFPWEVSFKVPRTTQNEEYV